MKFLEKDFIFLFDIQDELKEHNKSGTVRLLFNRLYYFIEHTTFVWFVNSIKIPLETRDSLHKTIELLFQVLSRSTNKYQYIFLKVEELLWKLKTWRVKADYRLVDKSFSKFESVLKDLITETENIIEILSPVFEDDDKPYSSWRKQIKKEIKASTYFKNLNW